MLSRSNRPMMGKIAALSGVVLLLDIFTIISNLFVSPVLEGYGLPDILIYVKTAVFLVIFVISLIWLKFEHTKLSKSTLKLLMIIGISIIAAYFLSLYLYKYILIVDTASIIKNKVLTGNPALILDFSGQNYKTLEYITTIFGGFNSEIILFFQAIFFQMSVYAIDKMVIEEERVHVYDAFLFDVWIFPLYSLLVLSSFLSINIFEWRYDLIRSIEMLVAIAGFTVVLPGLIPAFTIYNRRNNECTRSFFIDTYRLLLITSILGFVIFIGLFITNLYLSSLQIGSYRLITSVIAIFLSAIIFYRVRRILSLENK